MRKFKTNKDLIGTLISDIVLQLLSYVAQAERENIRIRQAEGIAVALASGVKFGRPPKPYSKEFKLVYKEYVAKKLTRHETAEKLGMLFNEFRHLVQKK